MPERETCPRCERHRGYECSCENHQLLDVMVDPRDHAELERERDSLRAEVERLRDCRQWPYYPIEMPLAADGSGPASVGRDAMKITYEVWDRACASHGVFGNLPDAINEALRLSTPSQPTQEQPHD